MPPINHDAMLSQDLSSAYDEPLDVLADFRTIRSVRGKTKIADYERIMQKHRTTHDNKQLAIKKDDAKRRADNTTHQSSKEAQPSLKVTSISKVNDDHAANTQHQEEVTTVDQHAPLSLAHAWQGMVYDMKHWDRIPRHVPGTEGVMDRTAFVLLRDDRPLLLAAMFAACTILVMVIVMLSKKRVK